MQASGPQFQPALRLAPDPPAAFWAGVPRIAGRETAVLEWDLDRIAGGGMTPLAADPLCRAALTCGSIAFLVGRFWTEPQNSAGRPERNGDQVLHPYRGAMPLWPRLLRRKPPRVVLTSRAATMRQAFEEVWWTQGGQVLVMFTGAPCLPLLNEQDWRHFAQGEFSRCAREFTRAGAWCFAAPGPDGATLAISILDPADWDAFRRHAGLTATPSAPGDHGGPP